MSTHRKPTPATRKAQRETRRLVMSCLHPGGNTEHVWSPDTLNEIRQALRGRRDPLTKRVVEILNSDLSTADALDEIHLEVNPFQRWGAPLL